MTRTPSKADLEQKEAERERKIKERKAQKEQEAARRKAEKAAHAEEIRNKKNALDAEKKRGMEKVCFYISSQLPKTRFYAHLGIFTDKKRQNQEDWAERESVSD